MNRGSEALACVFQGAPRGYQHRLAEEIGISQSWLSRLAAGAKPNREQSLILQAKLQIEPLWWDEPTEAESAGAA